MFIAWDTQLDPYFGFNLIIPVFCVVLIGGVGSFYGAISGALIIGLAENLAVNLKGAASGLLGPPTAATFQPPRRLQAGGRLYGGSAAAAASERHGAAGAHVIRRSAMARC